MGAGDREVQTYQMTLDRMYYANQDSSHFVRKRKIYK